MKAVPAPVLTLWIPALFVVGLCLFLNGEPPQYWTICVLIVPLLAYMNTLAEIHSSDGQIRIKRWWGSIRVAESEILEVSPSILEGIGRLRLRRFVPPWGIIYFLADLSSIEVPKNHARARRNNRPITPRERMPHLIASVLLAAAGFVFGRMLGRDFHALWIKGFSAATAALTMSASLAVVFGLTRRRTPTVANVLLFLATSIAALVHNG
jgi:hypothetical protein